MRKREEIWQEREFKGRADENLALEVLLDIRDIVCGKPEPLEPTAGEKCSPNTTCNCGKFSGIPLEYSTQCNCTCHSKASTAIQNNAISNLEVSLLNQKHQLNGPFPSLPDEFNLDDTNAPFSMLQTKLNSVIRYLKAIQS